MTQSSFYTQRLQQQGAVLAPMAGYSDAPMRQLATEYGALWTVSEMISARGLISGHENEDLNIGRPYEGEKNRVVQLFGADPDVLAEAVTKVEQWFHPAAIDLNMGCPVPKIRGKGGACLLQTPETAFHLVKAMRAATHLEVSVKMRLGWDSDRSLEVAQGLAEAGAALITVHGRTSAQRYTGEANWQAIQAVAQAVSIPVIGSGDIVSVEQAQERAALVSAVMIGRGAVGRPWIFSELAGRTIHFNCKERAKIALRHAQLQQQFYEKSRSPMKPLRKVLPKYFLQEPELQDSLKRVEVFSDVEHILQPILKEE